jgi:hypothetical protein
MRHRGNSELPTYDTASGTCRERVRTGLPARPGSFSFYVFLRQSFTFRLASSLFLFPYSTRPIRSTGMADAKAALSPSVSGDGSLAPTAPVDTMEGTTATAPVASGGDASSEESEDTPEARALAQGLYVPFDLFFYHHSTKFIALIVEFYFADTNLPFDKSVLIHYQNSNRIDCTQTDSCGHFTPLPMSTGSLSPPSLRLSVCVGLHPAAPTGSPPCCAQAPSSK